MNKDQIEGRIKEAKGSAKQSVGKAIGNKWLRVEGQLDEKSGKIRSLYGDLMSDLKKDS